MFGSRVVNQEDLLKDHARILGALEDWVKGIVVDALTPKTRLRS